MEIRKFLEFIPESLSNKHFDFNLSLRTFIANLLQAKKIQNQPHSKQLLHYRSIEVN